MLTNLSKNVKWVEANTYGTSGAYNGTAINAAGFESFMAVATISDSSGGGVSLTVQGGTSSTVFNTTYTSAVSTTAKNTALIADVVKLTNQWVRVVINSTVGNMVHASGILYGARVAPTTNASSDVASSTLAIAT